MGFSGRQFLVKSGSKITTNRINGNVGDKVKPDYVCASMKNNELQTGTSGFEATIWAHSRDKDTIRKKTRRKGNGKKFGCPQSYTHLLIHNPDEKPV